MSQEEATRIAQAVQRLRRSGGALKIALPTAAVLGAGAAVAVGAIPSSDGTIHGCYAGPNGTAVGNVPEAPGALRVIDPSLPNPLPSGGPNAAAACQEGETAISWNQRGPTGPQGLPGANGAPGAAGAQGVTGAPGADGTPLIGDTSFGLTNNAGSTFLKLDGIAGSAADKVHKGDIQIDSFSLDAQSSGAAAHGSGAGAGKATIQSFTITKPLDSASPLLFQAAASGRAIKLATLYFDHKLKGKQQDYLEFKMSNVLVSRVSDGQTGGGRPTEQVSFTFQKITETFLGSNGKVSETVGFNVSTNSKI